MRYANFLKKEQQISIIAPSFGVSCDPYLARANAGIEYFRSLNYKIDIGSNVYSLKKAESRSPQKRAKEFINAYKNSNSKILWAITGGEFELDILPLIPFDKLLKNNDKWFMGYSDNTSIGFVLTTKYDLASIYAIHIGDYSLGISHQSLDDALKLINGEKFIFNSYPFHENKKDKNRPLFGYKTTKPTIWKTYPRNINHIEGRLIGGCLDVLLNLCGTPYDNINNFNEKYKNDGIIFFFDVCELSSLSFYRGLFQLKEAGWFKYTKGIMIGRIGYKQNLFNFTYLDAIKKLKFPFPVIYDVDIGHVPPSIPIINGSYAKIDVEENKGKIEFILK